MIGVKRIRVDKNYDSNVRWRATARGAAFRSRLRKSPANPSGRLPC
jgi:hypothetical protein